MTARPRRANPFANLPEGQENNARLLLERVYWALVAELDGDDGFNKGKLSEHEGRIKKAENGIGGATEIIGRCPCNKKHDPGIACPLYILENQVYRGKWLQAGTYFGISLATAIFYSLVQLGLQYLKLKLALDAALR